MEFSHETKQNLIKYGSIAAAVGAVCATFYFTRDSEAVKLALLESKKQIIAGKMANRLAELQLETAALQAVDKLKDTDKATLIAAAALKNCSDKFSTVADSLDNLFDRLDSIETMLSRK